MINFDPEAVRAFEHAGWQGAAGDYNATFARASGQFAEALLDAAAALAGQQLLDVCCGTGLVTAAAATRGLTATGVDFSPAMLAEARSVHPQLVFDEGDAEALPYPDRSFDAVVSNFGMHHVPRPEQATAEAARVLRPGGRFAFTAWAVPTENIAWHLLFEAIRAHGDIQAAQAPPSGGNLGSEAAVRRLLDDGGFAEAHVGTVRREWRVAQPADIVRALARGTVRTAALIAAQEPGAISAIETAVADAAAPYHRERDGYAVPIVAVLGCGIKQQG